MNNQGQGLHSHFIKDLYVVCLYKAQISGECLQDHWSSGFTSVTQNVNELKNASLKAGVLA